MRLRALTTAGCCLLAFPVAASASNVATTLTKLSVRSAPGGPVIGKLAAGRTVKIACQENGPFAKSRSGSTRIWDRIRRGSGTAYVSDGGLRTSPPVPGGLVAQICGAPSLQAADPGATQGPCRVTTPVQLAEPYPDAGSFIKASVPGAQASQRETRVPSSVTIAQAILESGYGTATAGANNYFGIKAVLASPGVYRWATIAVGCVLRRTQEFRNGRMAAEIAAFRAYTGLKDSIRDHGSLLVTNPVYAAAFDHADKPKEFARIIGRHYATDPHYASSVIRLMDRYHLTKYDVKVAAAPQQPPTGSTPVVSGGPGGGVSPP